MFQSADEMIRDVAVVAVEIIRIVVRVQTALSSPTKQDREIEYSTS